MAKRLPEGWKTTYCAFIAEGYTRNDAASATGVAIGTVDRHQSEDDEFRELYVAAREAVRDKVRNEVWTLGMGGASATDTQTKRWALDHLIKWNLPEAKEIQRHEVDVAATVAIEDRSSSLHDVALVLAAAGALPQNSGPAPRKALPAAAEVLPEPLDG